MIQNEGNRFRFQQSDSKSTGTKILDALCLSYAHPGMIGNGTIHHIAFSTSSDANQKIIKV